MKEALKAIEDAVPKSEKVHKMNVHELRIRLGFLKRHCTNTNIQSKKNVAALLMHNPIKKLVALAVSLKESLIILCWVASQKIMKIMLW